MGQVIGETSVLQCAALTQLCLGADRSVWKCPPTAVAVLKGQVTSFLCVISGILLKELFENSITCKRHTRIETD